MNLKKIGKVFTSKSVGTGPSSYELKEYTGPRSHKGWETLFYAIQRALAVIHAHIVLDFLSTFRFD